MDLGQRAASVKFLIRDRAGQFTSSFDALFTAERIRVLGSPPQGLPALSRSSSCPRVPGLCQGKLAVLGAVSRRPGSGHLGRDGRGGGVC